LNSTDNQIDVFIEAPIGAKNSNLDDRFYPYEYPNEPSYMNDFTQELYKQGCVRTGKEYSPDKCVEYRNHVRFHVADVRASFDGHSDYNKMMLYFVFMHQIFNQLTSALAYGDEFTKESIEVVEEILNEELIPIAKALDFYDDPSGKKLRKHLLSMIDSIKINKQIDSIKNTKLKQKMHRWLTSNIDYAVKINGIQQFHREIENFKKNGITVDTKKYDFYTNLMDLYIMSRMFREFNDKGKGVTESKNIMIYTGVSHTEIYSKILRELGFKLLFSRGDRKKWKETSCLDLSGLEIKWITTDKIAR